MTATIASIMANVLVVVYQPISEFLQTLRYDASVSLVILTATTQVFVFNALKTVSPANHMITVTIANLASCLPLITSVTIPVHRGPTCLN